MFVSFVKKVNVQKLFISLLGALCFVFSSFNTFAINTTSPPISINQPTTAIVDTSKPAENKFANYEQNFLVITDIHLTDSSTRKMSLQPLGYNLKNDLDHDTFVKLLSAMDKGIKTHTVPKPQFILILGDIVGHKLKSINSAIADESAVFKSLKMTFSNTPIFYVFGNNDTFIQDYGPFVTYDPSSKKKTYSPYTTAIANGWHNGFLSTGRWCSASDFQNSTNNFHPCLINTNKNIGYFSAYINSHLRLISLNSVLFSPNSEYKSKEQETQKELLWFKHQLKKAKDNNDTVIIAMHIPVGNDIFEHMYFWKSSYRKAFLEIIAPYKNNIAGILVGHTHLEELKIIQAHNKSGKNKNKKEKEITKDTENIALMVSTAGLSTSRGNLPAAKTFFYAKTKEHRWIMSDFIDFNFTENKDNLITINPLYTYRDTYCKDPANDENSSMLDCLQGKSFAPIINNVKKYYTNGNPNFSAIILSPSDVYVGK